MATTVLLNVVLVRKNDLTLMILVNLWNTRH